MTIQNTKWVPGGYLYWTAAAVIGRAPRQIGEDWFCVVDDFGYLVPVRRAMAPTLTESTA